VQGKPQKCRLNALLCSVQAEQAATPQARQDFIAMADTWNKLAAELESDDRLLQAMSEMELSEPCYGLALALNMRSKAA
jgi:hypothetical protein